MMTQETSRRLLAADLDSRWNRETKRFQTLIPGVEEFRGEIFINGKKAVKEDLVSEIRKYGYDTKNHCPQWDSVLVSQARYDHGIRKEVLVEIFVNPSYPGQLLKQFGWNGLIQAGWAAVQWDGCPYCFAGIRDMHVAPDGIFRSKLIIT